MKAERRILIVENSLAVTGAYKSIVAVSTVLQREFQFHYCIPSRSTLSARLTTEGFSVFRLPFVEISRSLRSILLYVPMLLVNTVRLRNYVRRHRIDVVHVNDLFNMAGVLLKWWSPSVKLIYHVRLMPDSYLSFLFPWLMRSVSASADQVVFVSETVRRASAVKPRQSHVIHDGISFSENWPAKVNSTTSGAKILYLANYTPGKGHLLALEAFANALPSLPGSTLTFAGGDMGVQRNADYRQQIESRIREKGLSSSVRVQGFSDDVESLIKSHDILLNCSESESFSMTCLEAMVYGTPVIATDSGGPGEIIFADTGILVPNGNAGKVTEALIRLGSDSALRTSLAARARAEAERRFSLESSAAQLRVLYEEPVASA